MMMSNLNCPYPPINPVNLALIDHHAPPHPIPGVSQSIVGKYYRIGHKIGCGSFGEIYVGWDIRTNDKVAIKVENRSTKYPQLLDEYKVYRALQKGIGVPAVLWCGSNSNVHLMVMEFLGESLESLYNLCDRKFSLKTVTMLAIQLLHRIEHHHSHNYLHRDIKPDNFLMGPPGPNAHILYMIDMGLCKCFRDAVTLQHIPYKDHKKLIGTPRYASINTHLGVEQCRRDDLESIGYMLIYFLNGRLPWQGLKAKSKQEKYDKISQSKNSTPIEQLCKGFPPAFATYLRYSRQLRFTQKPDYKYLRTLFYDLFRGQGWKDDCIYDWMIPRPIPVMNNTAYIHPSQLLAVHQQQALAQVAAQAQASQPQPAQPTSTQQTQPAQQKPPQPPPPPIISIPTTQTPAVASPAYQTSPSNANYSRPPVAMAPAMAPAPQPAYSPVQISPTQATGGAVATPKRVAVVPTATPATTGLNRSGAPSPYSSAHPSPNVTSGAATPMSSRAGATPLATPSQSPIPSPRTTTRQAAAAPSSTASRTRQSDNKYDEYEDEDEDEQEDDAPTTTSKRKRATTTPRRQSKRLRS